MQLAVFRWAFVSLICLGASGLAEADVKEEIVQIGKEYDAAILKGDKAFLEQLYDDQGVFVLPDGNQVDKKAYIASALLPGLVVALSESSQHIVRSISDTVVVETATYVSKGTQDGKPFENHLRYTSVWIKKDGKWRVTSEQNTPITIVKK